MRLVPHGSATTTTLTPFPPIRLCNVSGTRTSLWSVRYYWYSVSDDLLVVIGNYLALVYLIKVPVVQSRGRRGLLVKLDKCSYLLCAPPLPEHADSG